MSSKDQKADNIVDDHEVIHGVGKETSSHVDRADKTAPMPEAEKGAAIPGLPASGGGNSVVGGDSAPSAVKN